MPTKKAGKLEHFELEDAIELGVRVGRVFHVVGSTINNEELAEDMKELIEDDLRFAAMRVAKKWPDLIAQIDHLDSEDEEGQLPDGYRTEQLARMLLRDCPYQFIVRIDLQHAECRTADQRIDLGGTWVSGFSMTHYHWFWVNNVSTAIRRGLKLQRAKYFESWHRAIAAGRVYSTEQAESA